jgi:hypothetical protein
MLAADDGHPERAARLFGAADGLREATGTPVEATDRATLGEEVCAALWAEGQALPLDAAVALAQET